MGEDSNDSDDSEPSELRFPPAYLETDRKRGILTENDRKYLLGEVESSGQKERNMRYRIRQRVIQSFLDMELLANEYPDAELEKVVNHDDIHDRSFPFNLVEIAYNALLMQSGYTTEDFEEIIEQVIRRQRVKRISVPDNLKELHDIDVDVDISVRKGDIQHMVDSLVEEEVDIETWAAFARRVDVFYQGGVFERDDVEMVPIQPPGAEHSTMMIKPIAEMVERSVERHEKE